MTIVLLLIPLAFILVTIASAAFLWAVDSGQYDNLEDAASAPLEADMPGDGPDLRVSVTTDSAAGTRP
jgi:cbb3-type cytochrome oxidase maturation protein